MILQNPLFTFSIKILFVFFLEILPILIMLVITFCLYRIYNKNVKEYDYKIFDFDFNGFCIITYFLTYLYIIFWYKVSYINKTTDLKPFINFAKEIYLTKFSFFILKRIILFILIIICFIYIIKVIHKFFRKELKKRFLVLQITYNKINITPYLLQAIKQQCDTLLTRVFIKYDFLLSKKIGDFLWKLSLSNNNFIFYKMPSIILILFFFYIIFFNDYVLTPSFYKYLLFYFFYYNYKNISIFIDETDYGINKILFNMYYRQRTIKYINIPKDYQDVIMRYISLNLQRNLIKYPEPLLDDVLGAFYFKINAECAFFLVETIEKGFYSNEQGDHFLEINENVDINIYDFYFTKKIYKYLKRTIITKIISIIKKNTIMFKNAVSEKVNE